MPTKKRMLLEEGNAKRPEGETLLTPEEVRSRLKVSRSKMYLELTLGGLPHRRFGRTIRISPTELEEWLASKQA